MIADDSVPRPLVISPGLAQRKHRKLRRRRRPWYRRFWRVIPLAVLMVLTIVGGVIGYRTLAAFDAVHSLSTPPPELNDAALGGGGDTLIDTGPAQAAVQRRDARERARNEPGAGVVATTEPKTGGAVPNPSTDSAGSTTRDDSGQMVAVASATGASGEADAVPPTASGGTTILLMGVDARDGESIDVGVRPDALAVLHLDDATGSCRMLAIPRDSRATLPGYGFSKINHALAVGGIPYELQVVEGYLGLELDHYALVDFTGITQIIDSVGGVEVENPEAFTIDGNAFAAGPIHLDGERALLYARYRGGADGDFGRISRQQQVLRALLDEAREVNPITLIPSSFSLLSDHLRTDLGPTEIVDLATGSLDTCTSASLETRTIPGDVATLYDDLMGMDLSFVVSDPAEIADQVEWLLGGD